MKDSASDRDLFEYYNERAPEYEEFYWGRFPAKIPSPDLYRNDTLAVQKLLPDYVGGKCIDIACGTGFWLPVYEKNCTDITLLDQSESVLDKCRKKISKLGIENKVRIIRNDIFHYPFEEDGYESALVGFLISHFTDVELRSFLDSLKVLLRPGGKFTIIDSVWSEEIAAIRKRKAGMITRTLSDGREFDIYKRFFEKQDLHNIAREYGISLEIVYWGRIFFVAIGNFPGR